MSKSPEKYLKKALGAATSSIMGGTLSFMPALPLEPPPHMQFIYRLQELSYAAQWYSLTFETEYNSPYICTVKAVCTHGQMLEQQVSVQAMNVPKPAGLADVVMDHFKKVCATAHANIPPPGQFVYSLASSEPIAYAANNGPVHKIEDFKINYADYCSQQLAAEYQKIMEYQIKYGAYPAGGYPASVGWGGGGVGGMTGHPTVNALLKVCPGLKDASSTCPDCTVSGPLTELIPHINDTHKWTRERIANWLDTLPFDLSIKPPTEGNENGNDSIGSKTAIAATGDFGNTDALALAKEYGKYLQSAPGIN